MNQLQQTITMLTGQVEQLQYQNQQLKQQLDKMQTDYDFRLDQIEKGKGGGPRPPGPALTPPPPPGHGPTASATPPAGSAQGEQLYHDAFKLCGTATTPAPSVPSSRSCRHNPKHPLAGNAQYWLGETYYARREYQQAMVAFAEGSGPQASRRNRTSAEARHDARGDEQEAGSLCVSSASSGLSARHRFAEEADRP